MFGALVQEWPRRRRAMTASVGEQHDGRPASMVPRPHHGILDLHLCALSFFQGENQCGYIDMLACLHRRNLRGGDLAIKQRGMRISVRNMGQAEIVIRVQST